jgi:phosphoribosylaminoimidazole-succinocarboxamide synthase
LIETVKGELPVELVHTGKVRDVYVDGDDVLLVASDRVSVYDVVLPTPIPNKGKILTQLSLWWFDQLQDLVPNHVLSADDVPAEWAGRAVRCRRLKMVEVECIARGYLAGLGLKEYERDGAISGVSLPPGLLEGSKLPQPIFTPTTKATEGHDEFMTFADVVVDLGEDLADRLRDLTVEIYSRGAEIAARSGVIIADTKLEFGWAADGTLTLGDELLTSDSSRFWPAADWEAGRGQHSMDKQFVRDWAASTGWDKTAPGPEVPPEIIEATTARYIDVYERITGLTWTEE